MYYNALIKGFFNSLGIQLIGFAGLSRIDADARRGFHYGISIALPHYKSTLEKIITGSSLEALHAVNARNKEIKEIAKKGEEFIVSQGFNAFSQANVKRDENYLTSLSHKTVATLAGMGYIGKSCLLVTEEYGPAVRLSSILTDMPLIIADPIIKSDCGECRICTDACPTGALLNHNWSVESVRSNIIDLKLCKKEIKKRELEFKAQGDAICGVCVAACPKAKGV